MKNLAAEDDIFLEKLLQKNPPQTELDWIAIAVRRVFAAMGPSDMETLQADAVSIASGLFAEAYDEASPVQKKMWINMAEAEILKLLDR